MFYGLRLLGLDLSDNRISDIRALSGVVFAEEIDLGSNLIVDISPLSGVDGLSTLDLSDNAIVDVSPLAELPRQLIYLDISNNMIVDISPLVRSSVLKEDGALLLYANPLEESTLEVHLATLRSRGVEVAHIYVQPIDSSAKEGEDFEFVVRLSSEIERPISFDWRVLTAIHIIEGLATVDLSNFQLSAKLSDFPAAWRSCWNFVCDLALEGELGIGAMHSEAKVDVLGASEDETAERHETFGFALFPKASGYTQGVALPEPDRKSVV